MAGIASAESTSYVFANGQRVVKVNETGVFYYHSDHLGSTSAMTDSNGDVVEEQINLPFGEPISGSEKYGFTGKEQDETGLEYSMARYYDFATARFWKPDPAKDGVNWYGYANDNPLKYIDPDGRRALMLISLYIFLDKPYNVLEGLPELVSSDRTKTLRQSVDSHVSSSIDDPFIVLSSWNHLNVLVPKGSEYDKPDLSEESLKNSLVMADAIRNPDICEYETYTNGLITKMKVMENIIDAHVAGELTFLYGFGYRPKVQYWFDSQGKRKKTRTPDLKARRFVSELEKYKRLRGTLRFGLDVNEKKYGDFFQIGEARRPIDIVIFSMWDEGLIDASKLADYEFPHLKGADALDVDPQTEMKETMDRIKKLMEKYK